MAPNRDKRGRFVAQNTVVVDPPAEEALGKEEGQLVSGEPAPEAALDSEPEFPLGTDFTRRCEQLFGRRRM